MIIVNNKGVDDYLVTGKQVIQDYTGRDYEHTFIIKNSDFFDDLGKKYLKITRF